MSTVEKELAKQQKLWGQSKPRKGLGKLPAGTYEARIVKAFVKRAKTGKKGLGVVWQLKVTSGKVKGATAFKRSNLGTRENMDFLKGEMEVLDLEVPEEMSELNDALSKAKDMLVEIRVVEKGEYTNIYFNEALGVEDSEEEEESEDEKESEDTEESEDSEEEESSDEEEEEKPRRKKKKDADEEEESEGEKESEEEEGEEESESEDEEKPRKKGKKSKDSEEEDEEESSDDDEEVTEDSEEEAEEKPRPKKKLKKKVK